MTAMVCNDCNASTGMTSMSARPLLWVAGGRDYGMEGQT